MKKALVNYWVDLATGVAFILCAVTGIVFLFPAAVHTAVGTTPTILLIPAMWWHSVHDWTGVAMVAGTALHLALHAKWITVMTRKTFGTPAQAGAGRARRPARVAGAARQPAAGAAVVAAAAQTPVHGASAQDDAAASLERLEALRDGPRREHEQRISRRRFLAGTAVVGGAALVAGVGLFGRDAVSQATTRLQNVGGTGGGQSQPSTATSGGAASGSGASGSASGTANASGSTSSSTQSAPSGGASSTQVVVAQSACVACGRCLEVCPAGVFGWSSSGRAEAVNASACTRCGRCLQVCPAGAITVGA